MRHYVTLFDKDYLAKGLALFKSLQERSSVPFTFNILALDNETNVALIINWDKSVGPNTPVGYTVYPYSAVSNPALDLMREYRTKAEFAWMMASYWLALNRCSYKEVTYLDSDLFFYYDPELVWKEIGDKKVAIIPHRFPEHDYARLAPNGLFNVSWVTFREDPLAKKVLSQWVYQNLSKCSEESAGDQKYLDNWPFDLEDKLCVIKPIGMGAGPWNIYTYKTTEGPQVNGEPLVFFHLHEHRRKGSKTRTGYPITSDNIKYIYEPYEKVLDSCEELAKELQERRLQ